MKKFTLFTLAFVCSCILNAQVLVSSLPKDSVIAKSAALEVKSNDHGFLPPRLSSAKRRAIKDAAPGLIVFDTTKQLFFGFTRNTGWRPLLMGYDTVPVFNGLSPAVVDNESGDNLGYSVAIYGDIAVAGAPLDNVNGKAGMGSLYVFRNDGERWKNIQKLSAKDGAAGDNFGTRLSITAGFVLLLRPAVI